MRGNHRRDYDTVSFVCRAYPSQVILHSAWSWGETTMQQSIKLVTTPASQQIQLLELTRCYLGLQLKRGLGGRHTLQCD